MILTLPGKFFFHPVSFNGYQEVKLQQCTGTSTYYLATTFFADPTFHYPFAFPGLQLNGAPYNHDSLWLFYPFSFRLPIPVARNPSEYLVLLILQDLAPLPLVQWSLPRTTFLRTVSVPHSSLPLPEDQPQCLVQRRNSNWEMNTWWGHQRRN